ncbi:MAG: hypothetical protein ABI665_27020 [Vicinamibacterales bacterium]
MAWSALLTLVLVWLPYPLASVIPLLVLLATFEVIRPLHFGSERLGRYIQVFYEEVGSIRPLAEVPSWERVAMVFGGGVPGAGGHPLFVPVFGMATLANYIAVVLPGPVVLELGILAVPHLAFLVWLALGDRAVRAQRGIELARFRALRDEQRSHGAP